jgi:hypothetical protein
MGCMVGMACILYLSGRQEPLRRPSLVPTLTNTFPNSGILALPYFIVILSHTMSDGQVAVRLYCQDSRGECE